MNHRNLPKDKQDFKSVEVLARLDRPMVISILPELLEWLQDMNWPIAREIVEVLLKYKAEIIPHVQTVFSGRDTGWIYNILGKLMINWESELVSRLSASLQELAQTNDPCDGTDLLSIEIMWKHHLMDINEATALLARKRSEAEDHLCSFTPDQKGKFLELEYGRLHILNTDIRQIVNHCEENGTLLLQKYQYEDSLRRYEEIEETMRAIR